jgi:tetratricopeptide (TPR) repeat protein
MALCAIGFSHLGQGEYATARDCLERGLSLCRETGSRRDEGWANANLSQVALGEGDYVGCITYSVESLRVFGEIDERFGEGWVLFNPAHALLALGRYAEARACLERRLDIGHQIGDLGFEYSSLGLLCQCSYRQGDSEAAQAFGHRALALLTGLDDDNRRWRAIVLTFLGHTMADVGCLDDATDAYEQVLALQGVPDDERIGALAGLARVCLLQGDRAHALAHVEEAMDYLNARSVQKHYHDEKPFLEHLTCYRVLRANGDSRAWEVLDTAHRLLQVQADKISDEALRRSFLEKVAAHREIIAAWQEASAS